MGLWDKHWFGPVAAIRPYLFQKCFLMVVAFDLLVLMIERGARYGLNNVAFNVPHFRWLDSFHRMFLSSGVPDATFYVAVLVITSFLAFCLVLGGHRSWLMAIVCGLYTYAWSMSRLDSYLHHYMLSLILFCMIFFPPIDGRTFSSQPEESSKRKSASSKGLGWLAIALWGLAISYRGLLSAVFDLTDVQRWIAMFVACGVVVFLTWWANKSHPIETDATDQKSQGPLVSAWAVRLLGTTVGVIYIFTSIAKMDMEWCGGHTLQQVGTTAEVLSPFEQIAASLGLATESFWAVLATFVIPLELTLAALYLAAVRQDESGRSWLRQICFVGWLLAIGLHLNNEMMNLIIQWFGYYMLLLATILLLPARVLLLLGSMFYVPEQVIRERYDRAMDKWGRTEAAVALGVVSILALVALFVFGFLSLFVSGGILAAAVICACLVILLVFGLVSGWGLSSVKVSLITLGSALLMTFAVAQCSMRFDYHDLRGKTLQNLGNQAAALQEMELAASFRPPSKKAAAELHTNLGLSYRLTGEPKKAARNYRKAIILNSEAFLAHYGLANLLVGTDPDSAMTHYRNAIRIKSDFSSAWVNLGNALEFRQKIPEAIQCYEKALTIEKDAADIQQMLENAQKKLGTNAGSETSK